LSFVGHEDYASFRSSFRGSDPNTPARDPTDFHHGLLGMGRECPSLIPKPVSGLSPTAEPADITLLSSPATTRDVIGHDYLPRSPRAT